jgi:VanZ family protein
LRYKLAVVLTAVFALFIAWVIYMANTGQKSIFFDLVKMLPYGDKIGHFFLFGLLALGATIAFKFRSIKLGQLAVPYGAILISCLVVIEELSQKFIPGRTFDLNDIIASLAGVLVCGVLPFRHGKE